MLAVWNKESLQALLIRLNSISGDYFDNWWIMLALSCLGFKYTPYTLGIVKLIHESTTPICPKRAPKPSWLSTPVVSKKQSAGCIANSK